MLKPVTPDGLYALWPWVRAGLEKAVNKTSQRYLPEDVYVMLRGGRAWLYVVGEQQGFAVMEKLLDPDGLVLFVFAMWGEPWSIAPMKAQLYDELTALAQSIGAKRVRMQGRKGWEAEAYWKPTAIVFEHELETP